MNSNAGRDLVQEERCWPKNKSLDLWLRPWSLRNLDRLGPCNTEPFKRSKAASHRYFLKYFSRQYSQENTSVEFFFICKVAGLWNYSRADFSLNTSGDFFWQVLPDSLTSTWVLVLWFCTCTCFQLWPKTSTILCTNNSLLSRDNTISSFAWIDLSRDFRIYFGKILLAFDFDENF